jgi:hypothetical protein
VSARSAASAPISSASTSSEISSPALRSSLDLAEWFEFGEPLRGCADFAVH